MILGSGLLTASGWPKASDWLIRDEFTDTVAAGSVNGTAAQPGPGTRAVTDTESKLSVGGGALAIGAKSVLAGGDPAVWYGSIPRTAGVAFFSDITAPDSGTSAFFGFDNDTSGFANANFFALASVALYARNGGVSVSVGNFPAASGRKTCLILRSSGALFFVKTDVGKWILLWIDSANSAATLYPHIHNYSAVTLSATSLRCIALPAPFDTDAGLATDTHSGAVSAGTTFTHESDVWMEFIATTVPSGDSIDVQFRKADSLNYWICRINSSGDISLEEVVDGSETQRGLAAGVVSNGHRVVIIADDESIRVLSNNTSRISYGSAASAKTATAGEVDALGTGGAVSNVYTWPRTLGATAETTQAASILNKVSA